MATVRLQYYKPQMGFVAVYRTGPPPPPLHSLSQYKFKFKVFTRRAWRELRVSFASWPPEKGATSLQSAIVLLITLDRNGLAWLDRKLAPLQMQMLLMKFELFVAM